MDFFIQIKKLRHLKILNIISNNVYKSRLKIYFLEHFTSTLIQFLLNGVGYRQATQLGRPFRLFVHNFPLMFTQNLKSAKQKSYKLAKDKKA